MIGEARNIGESTFRRVASASFAALTLTAVAFAPMRARADDAPPVCPYGYAFDADAGRCVPHPGSYPTPLQQTSQGTYVPQSVALSGPAVIKDWQEGDPIPDGYHVGHRPRTGLIVGGAVTFGVLYLFSVIGAATVHDVSTATGGSDNADALFFPGVGPFFQMTKTSTETGNVFNVIDGSAQCAGLAMLIVGLTSPRSLLVRNDLAQPWLLPTPYVAHGGGGLGLVGQF